MHTRLSIVLVGAALAMACDSAAESLDVGDDVRGDAGGDIVAADVMDDAGGLDVGDVTADADVAPGDAAGDAAPDAALSGPPELVLTINAIPAEMNGSAPYLDADGVSQAYRLRANRANVTLDVLMAPDSGAVDWDSLDVQCDDGVDALALPDATQAADGRSVRYGFDAVSAWADGLVVSCTAGVTGPEGADSDSLDFETATLTPALDPFATTDVWLVVTSRDQFRLDVTINADKTVGIRSIFEPQGNGVPDFDEAFQLAGVMSEVNATAAALVKAHLIRRTRDEANRIFGLAADGTPTADGVNLRLWFEGDVGAPSPADFAAGGLSMMALGGDGKDPDQQQGTFGRALIDWNNQASEDDTEYGFGVFTTSIVRTLLGQVLGVVLLDTILAHQGGVAFGDAPGDMTFVGQELDAATIQDTSVRRRYELYELLITFGSKAMASVLTHEMGHSLGLVPLGPPPKGLFAEVDGLDFTVSDAVDAHIDTAGLNVMQTGGSIDYAQAFTANPVFNPLNWAYLRRQLVVGPN